MRPASSPSSMRGPRQWSNPCALFLVLFTASLLLTRAEMGASRVTLRHEKERHLGFGAASASEQHSETKQHRASEQHSETKQHRASEQHSATEAIRWARGGSQVQQGWQQQQQQQQQLAQAQKAQQGWQQQQEAGGQGQQQQQQGGSQGEQSEAEEPMEDFFQSLVLRRRQELTATWQTQLPSLSTWQSQVPPLTSFWKRPPLPFLQPLFAELFSGGTKYNRQYTQYKQDRQNRQYGRYRQYRQYGSRRALTDGGSDASKTSDKAPSTLVVVKRAGQLPVKKCSADPLAALNASDIIAPEIVNWVPKENRYLLPICQFGRLSNQHMCMRYYFWFAGLLNRTLIVPRLGYKDGVSWSKYYWQWDSLLDAPSMRYCLSGESKIGEKGSEAPHVITMDEYLTLQGKECLDISRSFACTNRSIPHFDPSHQMPGTCQFKGNTEVLDRKGSIGHAVTPAELEFLHAQEDPVITLGSLFTESVQGYDIRGPLAPFRMHQGCRDLWNAHPSVISLVDQLTANFSSGQSYAAMHLRRGDFARHYKETYATIPEIADVLHGWLEPLNVSLLYLSSDGSPTELQNLEELLTGHRGGQPLRIIQIRGLMDAWGEEISKAEPTGSGVVLATLEKYICSKAKAFLGTQHSTFTAEIQRIRMAIETASCWDSVFWKKKA